MADNVTVDNGALPDYTASTDDAGAAGQVQRIKLAYSADGVATHVDADANGLKVQLGVSPSVGVVGPSASTGAVTAFTSTTSATIWSANAAAKLRTFTNDSDVTLYLMLRAAAASVTAYHVRVAPGGFFSTDYTGEVRGILSAAIGTGQVNVGEFT